MKAWRTGVTVARVAWIFIALLSLPNLAVAATYYVSPTGNDNSVGSGDQPWRTLGKAAATMVAGDTTIVRDGVYVEANINFGTSGSSGNPITLQAENPWQAILSSTSGCSAKISTNASYITIDGLRFKAHPSNIPCAGGHNSTDGTGVRAFSSNVPHLGGTETTTFHHTTVRNTYHDPCGDSCSHSIKLDGDGSLAENNVAYNGMETGFGEGTVLRYNQILGMDGFGNGLGAGKFGNRNTQVYGNFITGCTNWSGCVFIGGSTAEGLAFDTTTDIECYNSVFYDNVVYSPTATAPVNIVIQGCKDALVAYNTFVGNTLQLRHLNGGGSSAPLPINPTWKNNTLTATGGCTDFSSGNTGTLTIDYNNFRTCTSPPTQTHPVSGDPLLDANYAPQAGSVLIDAGDTITTWPKYGGGTITLNRSTPPSWYLGLFAVPPFGAGTDVGAREYIAPVGAFTIPNVADAFHASQAQVDTGDLAMMGAGNNGVGVVVGCTVAAQPAPDMTLAVSSGVVRVGTSTVAVSAGAVTITTAHATNPRFDLVVVDSAGVKSVVAGTAAASPVYPAIPASSVVLAAVYVPASDTAIANNQIISKRVLVPLVDTVEVDFGAVGQFSEATPVYSPAVTPTSRILVTQSGQAATGRQADENEMDALVCSATPALGYFTVRCTNPRSLTHGKFKVHYEVY